MFRLTPRTRMKDEWRESRLFLARLAIAGAVMAVLFCVLIGRLAYLQIVRHEHYATLSESNRVRLEPITPNRGLIFDRNGVILAENVPNWQLEIVPEQVANLDDTMARLAEIVEVRPADRDRFYKQLRTQRRFQPVPLRFRLSEEEVARFAINRHRFPGVDIETRLTRRYPFGPLTAHVVGYVAAINEEELARLDPAEYAGTLVIGKTGVERSHEAELHGHPGTRQVETNAQGRPLRVIATTPPVPGADLYLSIDIRLQRVLDTALGDYKGAAVAIDPRNGEVIALASHPSYDPNPFVDGIDAETYAALRQDPRLPLYNRYLNGQYPPGSTIKPFLAWAAINAGLAPESRQALCTGRYFLEGNPRPYRDWLRTGHGATDLHRAIAESCDVYFYEVGRELGIDRMHAALAQFGFGRATGIDLPGEFAGLLPSREWKRRVRRDKWYLGETIITSIGQGYLLATPLQLAQATALLAMRGRGFRPSLLHAVRDPVSGRLVPHEPEPLAPVEARHPRAWQRVIDAMVAVVHGPAGTARTSGAGAAYHMAGKTGTAQVFSLGKDETYDEDSVAEELRDHGLFIAFAPAEDPRLALAVIIENGGGGSRVAAPVARQIFDAWLMPQTETTAHAAR